MKKLIIVGAGNFGLEVYSWLSDAIGYKTEWDFKGFLSDDKSLDNSFCKENIVGGIDDYVVEEGDIFVCAIANAEVKKRVERNILKQHGAFISLVHKSVIMLQNIQIGKGVIISPNCFISNSVIIGDHTAINVSTTVGHNVEIGAYSQISANCDITGHVKIGHSAFLGSSATIIPKMKIGNVVTIGAGSVVIKNVKDEQTVFGNPAKVIS